MAVAVEDFGAFSRCYGHEAGVALAESVRSRLMRAMPAAAAPRALGGAVFTLIAPDAGDPAAAARALIDEIARAPLDAGFGPMRVGLSVGGVSGPAGALREPAALDAALAALDEAVAEGASQIRPLRDADADAAPASGPAAMRAGAGAVMRALQGEAVGIAYQPVASAHDGRIAFRECLARLRDASGAWIAAGRFVPAIEKLDLVATLDHRVLRLALETLRAQPTERLSVNVSARTLRDGRWLATLREGARGDPRSAERLIVELTESAAVADVDRARRFLDGAREQGCAIALDDFGAGHSSFRHLRDFRPDWVKIDGGFVRNLAGEPDNLLFVDTMVGIARNFDMATVAECVETGAEAAALRMLGVDCLQGWHVGKPVMEPDWIAIDRQVEDA
jgi:EAL domain-containing protein (putative c-di-GMP-specific phosphodiesterase class I)